MSKTAVHIRRMFLPYCIQRRKDGKYVLLNRGYKLLGDTSGHLVDYDVAPGAIEVEPHTLKKLEERFAGMQCEYDRHGHIDRLFFYRDGIEDKASQALDALWILTRG